MIAIKTLNKIQIIKHLLKVNGSTWFMLYFLERVTLPFTRFFYVKRINYETSNRLDGFNSIWYNYKEWSDYNWIEEGEEWTTSKAWKRSLVTDVMDHYIKSGKTILEIGPGGGRWSELLAQRAHDLILVDLTEKSIDVCKKKLKKYHHCTFYKNSGNDLSFIKDASIDYVWTFDVFVHIAPSDVESYLKEFRRIFAHDAVGIIHHSITGTNTEGFRSSLTNTLFIELLNRYGFKLVAQISQWGTNKSFSVATNDIISIITKK